MSNTLTAIMPKILARGLMALRERTVMPRLVNSDYSTEAKQKGSTVDVPYSTEKTATDVTPSNTPPAPSNSTPATVQITLDQWKKVDFHLTDNDILKINAQKDFIPLEMQESVNALARAINLHIHQQYKGVYGYVGTAGTTPFGASGAALGVKGATLSRMTLNDQRCPAEPRAGVLDFTAEAEALALAQFSDAEKVGSDGVKIRGEIGMKYGTQWVADDQVLTHIAGTITTGLAVKAATAHAAGVKTITATTAASTGACALLEGDIITFAGDSQTYVLTANATQASAATDISLSIEPGLKIALSGGEAIAVKASHVVNLVFHRDAIAYAQRNLEVDNEFGARMMSMTDPQTGISLRLEITRQYKQTVWELDALWGSKLVRREYATRLAG